MKMERVKVFGMCLPTNLIKFLTETMATSHVIIITTVQLMKKIGIVLSMTNNQPATQSEADIAACKRVNQDNFGFFLDPIYKGSYPQEFMEWIAPHAPKIEQDDMKIIHQPIDYLGVNYYMTFDVAFSNLGGLLKISMEQKSASNWDFTPEIGFSINPEGLTTLLGYIREEYNNPPIYITENGCTVE